MELIGSMLGLFDLALRFILHSMKLIPYGVFVHLDSQVVTNDLYVHRERNNNRQNISRD